MIEYNENFNDNSILPFFIKPQNDPAGGQIQFCYNLIVNLFEKGNSPSKQEFPEVKIKRQILDPYLKNMCKILSYYGKITIEIASPKSNHIRHQKQPNDIDIEISKFFHRLYINNTTPKFTKSKFNFHKLCIFNLL